MLYRWNQVDPYSAAILRCLITMLCLSLFMHYWRSHPNLAFVSGLCIGVFLGWAIPPLQDHRGND